MRILRPRELCNWGKMMSTTGDPRSIPNRHSWRRALAMFAVVGLVAAAGIGVRIGFAVDAQSHVGLQTQVSFGL